MREERVEGRRMTALHCAVTQRQPHVVELLLTAKAKILKNFFRRTPLDVAILPQYLDESILRVFITHSR